jgi:hypothetical protein
MATFVGHYVSLAAVERRLSREVVRRIYDDLNTGEVSDDELEPVAQLMMDAEAMFEGYCRGIYDLTALRSVHPPEAVRLALDCCFFLAADRFPHAVGRDPGPIWDRLRRELTDLRTGVTRLDVVGSPEPAANVGGDLYQEGLGLADTQPSTFHHDGFGSY